MHKLNNEFGGVSILIPAYDELLNLRILLPEINKVLDDLPHYPKEILVVLPSFASTNEIKEIENLGARVVIRMPTDSFGDALRTGFAAVSVSSEFIITLDADGSHSPSTIPEMLAVAPSAHLVTGSRYAEGGSTDVTLTCLIMSRALNLAFSMVFGLKSRDLSGNFKLYRTSYLSNIELSGENFDVLQELIFKVREIYGAEFVVKEVPYHFSERNSGKTKRKLIPYTVSYLRTLTKLLFMRISSKYFFRKN